MEYRIIKGKQIPERMGRTTRKYPLHEMQAGDCLEVSVPKGEDPKKVQQRLWSAVTSFRKRNGHTRKTLPFTTRLENGVVGLYKLKP